MSDVKPDDLFEQTISMAGYNNGNDYHKGVTFEKTCGGDQANLEEEYGLPGMNVSGIMVHHCTDGEGSSGSPLFLNEKGTERVVAMECGDMYMSDWVRSKTGIENVNNDRVWNIAVSMSLINQRVRMADFV
jgi:hypothetical protein